MNKYKEALKELTNYIIEKLKLDDLSINHFMVEVDELQELVDKEIEFESRKDKLVVGSEWECVVKHVTFKETMATNNHIGDVVTIIELRDDMVFYRFKRFVNCLDYTEHFLFCFKPKEVVK